jgi:fibronectin-binding autotransporter adhesin
MNAKSGWTRMWIMGGCALCASIAGAVLTGGTSYTVEEGQSIEISGETATIPTLTDKGTLTLKNGTALTLNGTAISTVAPTNGITASLTLESGATLTVNGTGDANDPTDKYFAVGYLGGTGTLTVASGAVMTVNRSRLWVAGNTSGHREMDSYATVNILGTLTTRILECAAFFPALTTPPYDVTAYKQAAVVNLEEGGLLSVYKIQRDDAAITTLNFNGGTLKALADNTWFAIGGGVLNMVIADGKNAIIDSGSYNIIMQPENSDKNAFLTLSGTGGLIKRGSGTLSLNLAAAYNTFTGAIAVEAGKLSLGRPLADGQTVTVSTGAAFIPYSEADLSKITYQTAPTGKSLFTVQASRSGGLDLVAMADTFYTDRLGGPISGLTVTLDGTVTHADATVDAPFLLIGQSAGGVLALTNTTLDTVPVRLQGIGIFRFTGSRTLDASQNGYLQIGTNSTYQQETRLTLSDNNSVATLAQDNGTLNTIDMTIACDNANARGSYVLSNGTLNVSGMLRIGYNGGAGTASILGGKVTASNIYLGSNSGESTRQDDTGTLIISNASVTVYNTLAASPFGLITGADRTTKKNQIFLYDGATLSVGSFNRNDDPKEWITFAGGSIKAYTSNGNWFSTGQNGIFGLEALKGYNIILDTGTYTNQIGTSMYVTLTGEGGLAKRGSGLLKLGSSGTITADYQGDTTVESGLLQLSRTDIIPDGSGKGNVVVNDGATFNLAGYGDTVNAISGSGVVTNSTSLNVPLSVGGDDKDAKLGGTLTGPFAINKVGAGTLAIGNMLPDGGLTVSAGTAAAVGTTTMEAATAGFTHYRFKVEAMRSSTAGMMQLAELKLLCDGTDVTGLRSGITFESTALDGGYTYPDKENPNNLVDGNINTKWLDKRIDTARPQSVKDQVWVSINYASAQRVTAYAWATANDSPERDPTAWRLQGSNDGTNWTDLDVQSGFSAPQNRLAWLPATFSSTGSGLASPASPLFVANGGTFTLDSSCPQIGMLNSFGTVSLLNGAIVDCVPSETMTTYVGGSISGDGSLAKGNAGTTVLNGTNTYSGDTHVRAGTLRLGTFAPKYFRLSIRKTGGSAIMQLSEFSLFSADGTRQGTGLTMAADGTAATSLAAGTFAKAASYSHGNNEDANNLFDNNTKTKWCMTQWNLNNANNSTLWNVITLRLADTAAPVTSYTFTTANDSLERSPTVWTLEASADGLNWVIADQQSGVTPPTSLYTEYAHYALPFGNSAARAIPPGSAVQVDSGATLDVADSAATIDTLKVDCAAGGGTITLLNSAANGAIYLTDFTAASQAGYEVPLTIGSFANARNLSSWKIYVNGEQSKSVMLLCRDGKLVLTACGTSMILQ